MNASDFIAKWKPVDLSERSAAQQHFLDLCELVGHPKPVEADKTGESFCFERGAAKQDGGDGWADVWKKDFFGWEYKGKHKDLDAAYDQLLQYRESLENPPLLVVCDMDRIIVHTNFTSTKAQTFAIPLAELDTPRSLEILRSVFFTPDKLKPGVTSEAITTAAAQRLADVALKMRDRGLDPQAVAHFLDRIVFCLFAEDVGLLPRDLFSQIVTKCAHDPKRFGKYVADLFVAMANGGECLMQDIRHFNGNLFDESPVLELTGDEIASVQAAAELDWSEVDASIFGTLFERGMDPAKRSQLGAHYTSRDDITTLVEPVVMQPLRREWTDVRAKMDKLLAGDAKKNRAAAEKQFLQFLQRLQGVRIRDLGFTPSFPQVNPQQLHGIEINLYAHDLAQMTCWIGYIQWLRANGYGFPAEPILRRLDKNFQCADALTATWPAVDFIVSNPPFLGGKKMRAELGDEYMDKLFADWGDRVPPEADFCCYWFEKARAHLETGKVQRAGLLATQAIRGGANRQVLKRIKDTGDIFFAESDRPWILDGANVHVSMIGFDNGSDKTRILDGLPVPTINANLTAVADVTQAKPVAANLNLSFMGTTKGGAFDIPETLALELLRQPNPHGRPNSDIVVPWVNGLDVTRRSRGMWIIDFGVGLPEQEAAKYEAPFEYVRQHVKPEREKSRTTISEWWLQERRREDMRIALAPLPRFLCTCRVSKHRIFIWLTAPTQPDSATFAFARADDYFFGVLQSRFHEVWALKLGTRLETRPRYTPTTCFETFPFPGATPEQQAAIAAAAQELDTLRTNWLNPPEWTREEVLEFPARADGPWARYVQNGVARYPRLVPKDADCAKKLAKRTLTNLYNERPTWLANAHAKLDAAVFAAYGWPVTVTDEQILERLLALNLQ